MQVEVYTNNSISRKDLRQRSSDSTYVVGYAVTRSVKNEYRIYRFQGSAVFTTERGATFHFTEVEHDSTNKKTEVLIMCRELAKLEFTSRSLSRNRLIVFVTFEYSEATVHNAIERQKSLAFEQELSKLRVEHAN